MANKAKEGTKEQGIAGIFFMAFLYALWALIFCILCWYVSFNIVFRCFVVEGASMYPYLNPSISKTSDSEIEDAVFINTRGQIKNQDVIVLDLKNEYIIKRVMATSNQYITIIENDGSFYIYRIEGEEEVTLADCKLVESEEDTGYFVDYEDWNYVGTISYMGVSYEKKFYNTFLNNSNNLQYNYKTIDGVVFVQVPEDSVFCLGDNRRYSGDSRERGFFENEQIVGNVDYIMKNYVNNKFKIRFSSIFKYFWKDVSSLFER